MKYNYSIIIIIIVFVLLVSVLLGSVYYNSQLFKHRIGFQNYNNIEWSPNLIKRFNIYQMTVNKNVNQFDMSLLQKQASPEEAEEYLKTGLWTWPNYLKDLYVDAIWSSPIVKIDPQIALNYAMSIYNKNAATELLAWNTKEGEFLLYGGKLGNKSTIKCSADEPSIMKKKTFMGFNLWNGYTNYKTETVRPEDIEKEMPGFSFIRGPCNPCAIFDSLDKTTTDSNVSCPFKLNVKGDNSVSEIWKKRWGL